MREDLASAEGLGPVGAGAVIVGGGGEAVARAVPARAPRRDARLFDLNRLPVDRAQVERVAEAAWVCECECECVCEREREREGERERERENGRECV